MTGLGSTAATSALIAGSAFGSSIGDACVSFFFATGASSLKTFSGVLTGGGRT